RAQRELVELLDEVGAPEVQVDGARVDGRVRARALDEAEQVAARAVDDRERVRVGGAQRHASGRVVGTGPDVAARRRLQLRVLGRRGDRGRAERLRVRVVDRRLEGGGAHVA